MGTLLDRWNLYLDESFWGNMISGSKSQNLKTSTQLFLISFFCKTFLNEQFIRKQYFTLEEITKKAYCVDE